MLSKSRSRNLIDHPRRLLNEHPAVPATSDLSRVRERVLYGLLDAVYRLVIEAGGRTLPHEEADEDRDHAEDYRHATEVLSFR